MNRHRSRTSLNTLGKVTGALPAAVAAKAWAAPKVAEAVEWATPRVSDAVEAARPRVIEAVGTAREIATPRIEHAREWAAPRVVEAVDNARDLAEVQFGHAVEWATPRVELVIEAVEPVVDEARSRGSAAVAALKGELVVPPEPRRPVLRTVALIVVAAGAAAAAFKILTSRKQDPWAPPAAPTWTPPTPVTRPAPASGSAEDHPFADSEVGEVVTDPMAPPDDAAGADPGEAVSNETDLAEVLQDQEPREA